MAPLRLTSVLQAALPHLSEDGRALLSVLGCVNGRPSGPQEIAQWLGFHNRYRLARALRREGLPPLEVVGGWARAIYWMLEAETTGMSLRELAAREHMDPAVAYRLVRRITGRRWSEMRREGLGVAMLRFREACGGDRLHRPVQRLAMAVGADIDRPRWSAPPPPLVQRFRASPALTLVPAGVVPQAIIERVPIAGSPFDVTVAGTRALVTRPHAAAVDVLEIHPLRVVKTIPVGPGPARVVISGSGARAYVTSQFAEAVCVIDLADEKEVRRIPLSGHPLGAVLAPDGRALYVTTNRDELVVISTQHHTVLRRTEIPLGMPEVRVHPSGRWIFAPGLHTGIIAEVGSDNLEISRRFEVGGVVQGLVVSADGQHLYAANELGWLDVIHLPSGRRSRRVDFATAAMGVALTVDDRYVVVGLMNAGRLVVLERDGLVERANILTGGKPRLIAALPGVSGAGNGDGGLLVANEAGWVDLLR
ncbi:MAG TPA: cytochrome D1 domain-containing protein [Gemmatimonadales bacterium]|nr:cytochrome D1 domain-containing protein [Gemmatimonadales bacterium]